MKQFFSYFKVLFIITAIAGILAISITVITNLSQKHYERSNTSASQQRVYDYADVLTDEEEHKLSDLIAKREPEIGSDIVLVTIKEDIYQYYYDETGVQLYDSDYNWEKCMADYADMFYERHFLGFNKECGDGELLLDNWYEGQKGSWLSTTGRAEDKYTQAMIDYVLDDVYNNVEFSPYEAYKAYINDAYHDMLGRGSIDLYIPLLVLISFVAALIFLLTHLKGKAGEKTTNANTYIEKGSTRFNVQNDQLVNKFVTTRIIPRNTSGGSGSSGGAGHHTSRGGMSHGGGGRRR